MSDAQSDLLASPHTKGAIYALLDSSPFNPDRLPVARLAGRRADNDGPGTSAHAGSRRQRLHGESAPNDLAATAADNADSDDFLPTSGARSARDAHCVRRDNRHVGGARSKLADATRASASEGPRTRLRKHLDSRRLLPAVR